MKYTEEHLRKVSYEAYNHGDVKFDIISARCALLVIDMQEEFVKPEWTSSWIPEATRQVPKIKKLIDFCRGKTIPVIYTAFRDTHAFRDRPKYGNTYGAFYDTPLETILKNLDKDTIIICGTLTNYCCGTTARQEYERGPKPLNP